MRVTCVLLAAAVAFPLNALSQSCSSWNFSIPNTVSSGMSGALDYQEHIGPTVTNEHDAEMKMKANCTYADQAGTTQCYVTCGVYLDPVLNTTYEQGKPINSRQHVPGVGLVSGNNSANNGPI